MLLLKAAPYLPAVLRDLGNNTAYPVDLSSSANVRAMQATLQTYLDSHTYHLAVRGVFLVVSSLSIVWVYLTVRMLKPRPRAAALGAAAFVALSWEVGYHARFIAVDTVVMQFVALEIYAFFRSWRAAESNAATRWAAVTAAAAGAAWAGKTPALFVMIPALALVLRPGLAGRQRRSVAFTLVGAYGLSACLLSPSAFIDPFRYLGDMAFTRHAYNDISLVDQNFLPTWHERLAGACLWMFGAVPSPSAVCALVLSAIAVWGWVSSARKDWTTFAWTGAFAIYLAFMALNHVLIIRNCMLAVGFIAVMFGVGLATLLDSARNPWFRRGAFAIVVAILGFNAGWGLHAARTIQKMTPERALEAARTDLEREHRAIKISPALAANLGPEWTARRHCHAATAGDHAPDGAKLYLYHSEHAWNRWTNNHIGALDAVYGALEVNYDWYISFPGKMPGGRIVRLTASRARDARLNQAAFVVCDGDSKPSS